MRAKAGWMVLSFAFAAAATDSSEPVVSSSEQARIWDRAVRDRTAELARTTFEARNPGEIVSQLRALRFDPVLTEVEIDAAFYGYVQALRTLPASGVPDAALDWLADYRPQAWRLHDESRTALVPLFDIATAAAGLRNEKHYALAYDALLTAEPQAYPVLLDAYVVSYAADSPSRRGMEAAVAALPPRQLDELASLVRTRPALRFSRLNLALQMARSDAATLRELLATAPPAFAAELLRLGTKSLEVSEAMFLCETALAHADAGVRGVAIARASAMAAADPHLRERWLDVLPALLADPAVASAAALQIARWPEAAYADFAKQTAAEAGASLNTSLELIRRLRDSLPEIGDVEELP